MDSFATSVIRPGRGVILLQAAAVMLAALAAALTWSWDRWPVWPLLAVAIFSVGSDLMSVHSGSSKIMFSGMALGAKMLVRLDGVATGSLGTA